MRRGFAGWASQLAAAWLLVAAAAVSAQKRPEIGFISPSVVTDIGEYFLIDPL